MQLHLDEIATKVIPGTHAIVLLDQAGWHGKKNSGRGGRGGARLRLARA